MKIKIGSLVKVKIRLYFSLEKRIKDGDYAIVVGYADGDMFDYLVECNGTRLFVFKSEIQLVN